MSGIVQNFKDNLPVEEAVVSVHQVNTDGTLGAQVGDSPFYKGNDGLFTIGNVESHTFYAIWVRSPNLPSPNQLYYYRYFDEDTQGIVLEIGSDPPTEKASAGSGYLEIRNGSGDLFQENDTITVSDVCGGKDIMTATTHGKDFLVVREAGAIDCKGLKDKPVGIGTHQIFVNGLTYTVYVSPVNWADGTPPFVSTVPSLGPDLGSGLPSITLSGVVQNFKDDLPVEEAVVSVHQVNADGSLGNQVGNSPYNTEADGLFTLESLMSNGYYAIWARSPVLPSPNHMYYYGYYEADAEDILLELGSPPPTNITSTGGFLEIRKEDGIPFAEDETITISSVCAEADVLTATTCGEEYLLVRKLGDGDGPGVKDVAVPVGTCEVTVNGVTRVVYVNFANRSEGGPPLYSTVLREP